MTIKIKTLTNRPQIDLTGPDGNAYVLLALASRYGRELGLNTEDIHREMTSGDYENLVECFDHHFGEYVDLLR